jgi:hypothetical protein
LHPAETHENSSGIDRANPRSMPTDGELDRITREITIWRAYEADFIIEGCVVVELKAIAAIGRLEERQLLTYLKVGGFPLGYILDFGAPKLIDGIMRRVNSFPEGTAPFNGGAIEFSTKI